MKKLALLLSTTLLISLSASTFAMEDTDVSTERVEAKKMQMQESRSETQAERDEMKATMTIKREEVKGEIGENRMEAKENRVNFRTENNDELMAVKGDLTDEKKLELIALQESFKADSIELRDKMKNAQNDEEREKIRAEMDALREAQFTQMNETLGESASAVLEKRKSVYEENETLRAESRSMRSEYKAERKEYIDTYKGAFIKRIGDRLDKIPTANLEKAAEKIDALLEKVENNTRMSEEAKQTQLDAILALKEIILDRLDADESDEDVLGILEELITE